MIKFIAKLLGKGNPKLSSESVQNRNSVSNSSRNTGRRTPPIELDWSTAVYIPLPPSPPTWEVDGRDEYNQLYNDPCVGPVLQADLKRQHTKVVKLASNLDREQLQGIVGEAIAKSYRKLIIQRMKGKQFAAAAKQCLEMFDLVPDEVEDVDRRRFNRVINQLNKMGKKHGFSPIDVAPAGTEPPFTVSESRGWNLIGMRKLQNEERPEPGFEIVAVNGFGSWLYDQTSKSSGQPNVKSVLRRQDRSGRLIAEKHLKHDAYRISSVASGVNIAIMDSDGILYAYDANLNTLLETDLRKDPRVVDHFRTIETDYWGEFRTQVRAVDIAPEDNRFIFTLADEVWCCSVNGSSIWGLMMPLEEGWQRVVRRSGQFGIDREVKEALNTLGLVLPVDPTEIKRKYWKLAYEYHPDRNPDDPEATDKMKLLNHAFEVLTGVDPTTLEFEESDTTYFARTEPDSIMEIHGIRIELTYSGGSPQDWVYAASCSSDDGSVYIGTYSGKVVLVSNEGSAVAVYDIGTCPTEIVALGRYTYFLTPTRLYIVEDMTKLAAFLDVYQQGRLIVSEVGFGLLASKTLQWFTSDGKKLGELESRDPIRGIYAGENGAIVQTRQHQVEVVGLAI